MWRKSKDNYNYKSGKTLSLLQKIVVLITLVVCIALLPTSLFTTQKVARVIYDRVSINAVSINNILCNSPEIRESLEKQNKRPEDSVDSFMAAFVNDVDHSDEAGVAIYDKNRHLRVLYNPGKLPDFEHSARNLVDKYAGRNNISYKENYAIPNKAIGFVKDDNKKTIGYVVTGYSDEIVNNSTIDAVLFLLSMTLLGLIVGIWGAIYLAQRIKRVLFGYEPEEIARMLQERDVILNSVREGIININSNGCITLVNSEAQLLLKQAGIEGVNELFGKSAKDVLKRVPLDDIIKEGKTLVDASVKMGNTVFIITAVPLLDGKNIIGAVITFRKNL